MKNKGEELWPLLYTGRASWLQRHSVPAGMQACANVPLWLCTLRKVLVMEKQGCWRWSLKSFGRAVCARVWPEPAGSCAGPACAVLWRCQSRIGRWEFTCSQAVRKWVEGRNCIVLDQWEMYSNHGLTSWHCSVCVLALHQRFMIMSCNNSLSKPILGMLLCLFYR